MMDAFLAKNKLQANYTSISQKKQYSNFSGSQTLIFIKSHKSTQKDGT